MSSYESAIRKYYQYLLARDQGKILSLFSPHATFVHPIYHTLPAKEFIKVLLEHAKSHEIKIHNIFAL